MNYELAKELKDAGFPQNENNRQIHTPKCGGWGNLDPECRDDTRPVEPTLEELIEACGDDFDSLHKNYTGIPMGAPGKWLAEATQRTRWCCVEDSAEEAVGQLWLTLNKHEQPSTDKENG